MKLDQGGEGGLDLVLPEDERNPQQRRRNAIVETPSGRPLRRGAPLLPTFGIRRFPMSDNADMCCRAAPATCCSASDGPETLGRAAEPNFIPRRANAELRA